MIYEKQLRGAGSGPPGTELVRVRRVGAPTTMGAEAERAYSKVYWDECAPLTREQIVFIESRARVVFTGENNVYRCLLQTNLPDTSRSVAFRAAGAMKPDGTKLYEVRYRIGFYRGRRYVFAPNASDAEESVCDWVAAQPQLRDLPGDFECTVEPKE